MSHHLGLRRSPAQEQISGWSRPKLLQLQAFAAAWSFSDWCTSCVAHRFASAGVKKGPTFLKRLLGASQHLSRGGLWARRCFKALSCAAPLWKSNTSSKEISLSLPGLGFWVLPWTPAKPRQTMWWLSYVWYRFQVHVRRAPRLTCARGVGWEQPIVKAAALFFTLLGFVLFCFAGASPRSWAALAIKIKAE